SAQSMLDMSMYSVKSLGDLQERIRSEELADSTFVRDPLTLEDAWSVAQPEEVGPLGLTADQRPDTLCLVLGECGDAMLVA
uniref:Cyclic nucleotide-binding domain-containing protein n=1 Tax=Globodera pallida TaxID=36090 RepID=A0A183CP72_GLOPA